jgi:hypothetical protein
MGASITATDSTASIISIGSIASCVAGLSIRFGFFAMLSSSFGNPSTLSLPESLLPVPVRLRRRLGLFWLVAYVLWGNLDFAWGYQFYAARFGPCRRHVGRIEPVIVRVSDVPIGFSPFAIDELGY